MSLRIDIKNLSHYFKDKPLYNDLNYVFSAGSKTAILGENGSGKSTFLKVVSGFLTPSKGVIDYSSNETRIDLNQVHKLTCACSPFLKLEDHFTLEEAFDFHFSFKDLKKNLTKDDFFKICYLENDVKKLVKDLSSGMTQRFKLCLSILTESKLLLLDEPCSNLDKKGRALFHSLLSDYLMDTTLIVASNSIKDEISFCSSSLDLS